jgi:hypothetical protein
MAEEKPKNEAEVILDWVADAPAGRVSQMLEAVRKLFLRYPLQSYNMVERDLPIALPWWYVSKNQLIGRTGYIGTVLAQVLQSGDNLWQIRLFDHSSWTRHGQFHSQALAMEAADKKLVEMGQVLCPQPCSICHFAGPIHWHQGDAWRGQAPDGSVLFIGDRNWKWLHMGQCWDKYLEQRNELEAKAAAQRGGQHEPARTTPGGTAVGHPIRGPHRSWRPPDVEFPPPRSQGQDRANAVRRNLESQTSGRAFAIRVEMLPDEVQSALRDDPGRPVRLTREQSMKLYQTVRIVQRELLAYDGRAEPELPEPPYEVVGPLLDGYCRIYTQSQPSDWTGYEVALPSREQP